MKLAGVIIDWAGTLVDHGSCAPVETLRSIFRDGRVPVESAEVRLHMGLAKKTHIEAILALPRVREEWSARHGSPPSGADADRLYADFIPRQLSSLRDYSTVIEGVPQAIEAMRKRGLAIGSTTGYTRPMLDYLLGRAREQGLEPDAALCPGDAPEGRPAPWMCYLAAMQMKVYPMAAMVKIGDTPADIEEGLNAGMWTIGVTRTGNEVGLSADEWQRCTEAERTAMLARARRRLVAAGAHYTAESVAECEGILEEIGKRLDWGEGPWSVPAGNASREPFEGVDWLRLSGRYC
jgi:phosphonoacetaldehyde hydrolase